jgi:hypothetical protein
MSFQGPGSGISGTSNQFAVGYAQTAGNINGYAPLAGQSTYATYAGSAGNINSYAPLAGQSTYAQTAGYAPQAGYANQAAAYTNGNIGGNAPQATYAVYAGSAGNINGYAPAAGNANTAAYANNLAVQGIGGSTWAWSGQPGIPNHYWGSNQGGYHAVWQSNQGYVGYAGSAGNINGYAPSAGYAGYAGYAGSAANINGYAPSAGTASNVGAGPLPVWAPNGGPIYNVVGNGTNMTQLYSTGVGGVNGQQAAGFQGNWSAYFGYGIYSGGRVYVASDKRIKKPVLDEETPQYIDIVNSLQVERFTYVDTTKEGTSPNTGFYAQDVESIIPEAINTTREFIPNVFKLSENVHTDTQTITCKDHKLEKGDYIKCMFTNKEGIQEHLYLNITEVIDNDKFIVEQGHDLADEIFIYGKQVLDFKVLENDRLIPHTVGAFQELYKIVMELQDRVKNLESFVTK